MGPELGQIAPVLGPTVRRRILASRLRKLRRAAGMTLEDVAAKLRVSPAKISRLETEDRMPQLADVRELAGMYGLGEDEAAALIELARGARERGWWQSFDSLSSPESTYLGLESAANAMWAVDLLQIHGLLQIPQYVAALLEPLGLDGPEGKGERLQQIVQIRTIRQRRLLAPASLGVDMVVGQAAVETAIGSPAVMHAQVTHLLQISRQPNVTLRLLPFSAGATPAHSGSFAVLGFEVPELAEAVYLEGLAGQLLLDKPAEVDRYRKSYATTAERALMPEESREYLDVVQKRWAAA